MGWMCGHDDEWFLFPWVTRPSSRGYKVMIIIHMSGHCNLFLLRLCMISVVDFSLPLPLLKCMLHAWLPNQLTRNEMTSCLFRHVHRSIFLMMVLITNWAKHPCIDRIVYLLLHFFNCIIHRLNHSLSHNSFIHPYIHACMYLFLLVSSLDHSSIHSSIMVVIEISIIQSFNHSLACVHSLPWTGNAPQRTARVVLRFRWMLVRH